MTPRLGPTSATSRPRAVLAAVTLLLATSACPKKASYLPNDHGGFTLMTRVTSMEQALTRFRRSAEDICGTRAYTLSAPVITDRGWSVAMGVIGGSNITVQTDLTCQ